MYEYGTVGPIQRVRALLREAVALAFEVELGNDQGEHLFSRPQRLRFEDSRRRYDAVPVVADPHE